MSDLVDPLHGVAPAIGDAASAALPNLFLIGASKSGSSALHTYLGAHPDIAMSREKEPCFFVEQNELEAAWPIMARQPCSHDLDAYLDLWAGRETARYRGEGSVYYSQAPHRSGVPARIASLCPDARFIYIVREPVSRAIGHYWQRFKEFQEPLPLDQAVRTNALYRDSSDYALQLRAYFEHFDRSQFKVVIAENLRTRRREVLREVSDWLGLSEHHYSEGELRERHLSPPTSRRQRFPFIRHIRNSGLWAVGRRHIPTGLIDRLRDLSTVSFEKSAVDETEAGAYLHDYLAPKRADFEALIGYRVEAWG